MKDEKITLRLKLDHSVVLPEAKLMNDVGGAEYQVDFSAMATRFVTFSKSDWEPVPPPFVVPQLPGAVVRAIKTSTQMASSLVRAPGSSEDGRRLWVNAANAWWSDDDLVNLFTNHRILAPGVEL